MVRRCASFWTAPVLWRFQIAQFKFIRHIPRLTGARVLLTSAATGNVSGLVGAGAFPRRGGVPARKASRTSAKNPARVDAGLDSLPRLRVKPPELRPKIRLEWMQ